MATGAEETSEQPQSWELPFPFAHHRLSTDADWDRLRDLYRREPGDGTLHLTATSSPSASDRPLMRCLEVARLGGSRTAVIETRYIDSDYRSEYSAFYSKAFRSYEDSTHRIHFFQAE